MNYDHFRAQMGKVARVFGEKYYTADRSKTIWNAVEHLSEAWFENLVNSMITTQRNAPLPIEFMEAAKRERRKHTSDCHQPDIVEWKKKHHAIFTDAERAEFFSVIRKILNGEMTAQQGHEYAAIVRKVIEEWKAKHPGHFTEEDRHDSLLSQNRW